MEHLAERDIIIAAGTAYGSGAHPSTLSALQAIEGIVLNRPHITNILDVGCGSGILAIAAAKSFPQAHVIATDINPEAPDFVTHNAELNNVTNIRVYRCDMMDHHSVKERAPYDLVICNTSAELIIRHLRDFQHISQRDSLFVFSGIQLSQRHIMEEALAQIHLHIVAPLVHTDWLTIIASYETS